MTLKRNQQSQQEQILMKNQLLSLYVGVYVCVCVCMYVCLCNSYILSYSTPVRVVIVLHLE